MRQDTTRKRINRYGLKEYSIDQMGCIRKDLHGSLIDTIYDNKNQRIAIITCRGTKQRFFVDDLIRLTFPGIKNIQTDRHVPSIKLPENYKQFSEDENEYGDRGGGEWAEIREEAQRATDYRKEKGTNINYKVLI